jgi:hypothetical protein
LNYIFSHNQKSLAMKSIMYLFSFIVLSSMTFKNNVSPGDPIGGKDIKVGHKPPGGGQIFASGVTDANGNIEFKNIPESTSYYVEIGKVKVNEADLAKQRTATASDDKLKQPIASDDKLKTAITSEPFTIYGIVGTTGAGANRAPQIITKIVGKVKVTITYQGTSIRVNLVGN